MPTTLWFAVAASCRYVLSLAAAFLMLSCSTGAQRTDSTAALLSGQLERAAEGIVCDIGRIAGSTGQTPPTVSEVVEQRISSDAEVFALLDEDHLDTVLTACSLSAAAARQLTDAESPFRSEPSVDGASGEQEQNALRQARDAYLMLKSPRGDGAYLVGLEIAAGVWESYDRVEGCVVEVQTQGGRVIADYDGSERRSIRIHPSDHLIVVSGCGEWIFAAE